MPIKITSFNVNSDRRLEKPGPIQSAFTDFDLAHRYPFVDEFLNRLVSEEGVNGFALQEIDDTAMGKLNETFSRLGYKVITTPYCLDPGSFSFMFAYDPSQIEIKDLEQCYYTVSGEPTSNEERAALSKSEKITRHLETEFEKSAQIFTLCPLAEVAAGGEMRGYCIANTHPGLTNKHRRLSMQKLVAFLEERGKRLPVDGEIVLGDMNQFNAKIPEATLYMKQIEIFTRAGYLWQSEVLNIMGIKSSFCSYPFDIFRFLSDAEKVMLRTLEAAHDPLALRKFYLDKYKTISSWGGCLDAVFTRGRISVEKVKSHTFFGGRLVDTMETTRAELEPRIIEAIHPDEVVSDEILPSDHTALTITLR